MMTSALRDAFFGVFLRRLMKAVSVLLYRRF
jgi:hypothetical protein